MLAEEEKATFFSTKYELEFITATKCRKRKHTLISAGFESCLQILSGEFTMCIAVSTLSSTSTQYTRLVNASSHKVICLWDFMFWGLWDCLNSRTSYSSKRGSAPLGEAESNHVSVSHWGDVWVQYSNKCKAINPSFACLVKTSEIFIFLKETKPRIRH